MVLAKLKSFYLSITVGVFVFLAYFLLFRGLIEETAVFNGNGGAVILGFGMVFILVIVHLFAHIGFSVYSFLVFKGRFYLSSFLVKSNDGSISILKVCIYLLTLGYLCGACYCFITQKTNLFFYGLFLLSAVAATILYTSWLISILYERREKRFCEISHPENTKNVVSYQNNRTNRFSITAIVLASVGIVFNFLPFAPVGLTIAITGCKNAKKNNSKNSLCVIGLVLSALSCIWFLLSISVLIS